MRVLAASLRHLAVVLATVLLLSSSAQAQTNVNAFFGFGDSLADVGNIYLLTGALGADPAVPPSVSPHAAYFNGRFTNGPVAFEFLWELLSGQAPGSPTGVLPSIAVPVIPTVGAVDFAFGGTGTGVLDPLPGGLLSAPGLQGQIASFATKLNGAPAPADALYAIFTGANDYLNPLSQQNTPPEVVGNIINSISALYALGARHVIVVSLPDLGIAPFSGPNSAALTELTKEHNKLLKSSLHKLAAQLKELNLIEVDPNRVLRHGLPDGINTTLPALDFFYPPELFGGSGFRMSLCIFIDPATCADVPTFSTPPPGYLFWDSLHPTTEVHRLFAEEMYRALKP